jgi:hypothetical protein
MPNGFDFDTLVNPRQRMHGHSHPEWQNGFAGQAPAGAITPADLATTLEAAAMQLRALTLPSRPIHLQVYIDTLILVTDPEALAGIVRNGPG